MMGLTEGMLPPPNAVHVWRFSLASARQDITAFRHWLSKRENEAIERMVSLIERDK